MKKIIKDSKYKSIVNRIKKITETIDTETPSEEDIHEAVINFATVFEYIIKKKLYIKNKLLIYEFNSSDIDVIKAVLEEKIKLKHTINALDAFSRYKKFYPKSKLIKQTEGVEILLKERNELIHNITIKNLQKKEDLIGILNKVFPLFLSDAEKVLGQLPSTKVKKEKVYTEKDIQKIYEDIVLSKIKNIERGPLATFSTITDTVQLSSPTANIAINEPYFPIKATQAFNYGDEYCPRCYNYSLARKLDSVFVFRTSLFDSKNNPDLYTCSKCNLELTVAEYETVQKLIKDGKITERGWSFRR